MALYSVHNKITKPCVFDNRLPNKDRRLQQQEQKGQLVPDQEQKQNQQQQEK
ncbi:MAG: hypothetical protein WBQ25_13205 [Nitrososphaeraceae archaeon]